MVLPASAPASPHASSIDVLDEVSHPAALLLFEAGDVASSTFLAPVLLDAATATSASAAVDPDALRWVQIAAEGTYAKNGQSFTLDRKVFDTIQRNFRSRPSFRRGADGWGAADVIAYDWRHASEMPPTVPGAFESQQALGWARDIDVRQGADGKAQLWALSRFLPEAAEAIRKGSVKWTSIAVWPNATDPHGKAIGWDMSSIALTNDPHIQGMVPLGQHRLARGDETPASSAAPAASFPAREIRTMDEKQIQALLVLLGRHFNCAPTVEAIEHQVPLTFERVALMEKGAAAEPGRLQYVRTLLSDDGDKDGANVKDFDDAMMRVRGRLLDRRNAVAQLATDRDGLLAELQALYGGEVKDEQDRVGKDVKATMERSGLDPTKDQRARIAASGLLLERTAGVMPPTEPTAGASFEERRAHLLAQKNFLATRKTAATAYADQYPAPDASAPASPATVPHLYAAFFGEPRDGAPPQRGGQPALFGAGRPPSPGTIPVGNGGLPLTAGPQAGPEQGGLDFARFMACAGRNEIERAVAYVRSMDPANAKLEQRQLFDLARPIAARAKEIAAAQGITL